MPLKEKKRDISLLLQISCSETQLLLQVNRGLRHAEMLLAHITCTAFNPNKLATGFLSCNQVKISKKTATAKMLCSAIAG